MKFVGRTELLPEQDDPKFNDEINIHYSFDQNTVCIAELYHILDENNIENWQAQHLLAKHTFYLHQVVTARNQKYQGAWSSDLKSKYIVLTRKIHETQDYYSDDEDPEGPKLDVKCRLKENVFKNMTLNFDLEFLSPDDGRVFFTVARESGPGFSITYRSEVINKNKETSNFRKAYVDTEVN